jgi:hypothetical protein
MLTFIKNSLHYTSGWARRHKILSSVLAFFGLAVLVMYGIAQWYIHSERSKPLQMGVSFIPAYARSLGVDPKQNMDGLLGIGVNHFRLVSYWNSIEYQQGSYDFSDLDWQFEKAEAKGAKISLSLGLRQPRWPECHMPDWAKSEAQAQWQPQLEEFITAVIERYKASPSLESYQLENEYFLKGFGICTNHDRQRLVDEYNLVKRLDPEHKLIISRSNNALGFPTGQPQPDEFAVSVYKRVWSPVVGRYYEYPIPAWYYAWQAGAQQLLFNKGKDMIIHELQAEAWAPHGKSLTDISLDEQNKSLNAKRFKDRIQYGKATGMREIYLWGSEYWYYRLKVLNDPSLWDVAKQEFQTGN